MPIKHLASSLNQQSVNVSCYDSSSSILRCWTGFSWSARSIQAQCGFMSGLEMLGNPRMTSMTLTSELHVSWRESADPLPVAEGNRSCNHKQFLLLSASLSQTWSGRESWITLCWLPIQANLINKIPNAPSSEWWCNKQVDRSSSLETCIQLCPTGWISDQSEKEIRRELRQLSTYKTKHSLIFKF